MGEKGVKRDRSRLRNSEINLCGRYFFLPFALSRMERKEEESNKNGRRRKEEKAREETRVASRLLKKSGDSDPQMGETGEKEKRPLVSFLRLSFKIKSSRDGKIWEIIWSRHRKRCCANI